MQRALERKIRKQKRQVAAADAAVQSAPDPRLIPYLTVTDSGFMRFQNGAVDGKYLIEYYDKDYNIQETIQLDAELPLFGGFYETEDYYFVLSGEQDYGELRTVESYRITKYDKEWNRLDSVGMMDCNTAGLFEAGSARFAVCGNYLLIRTCHEMDKADDGYNHQANMTIQLDMESMEITDSFTDVSNANYGYVSHSFNQFIRVEDNHIVAFDHGYAYPRSLVIFRYNTDLSTGRFYRITLHPVTRLILSYSPVRSVKIIPVLLPAGLKFPIPAILLHIPLKTMRMERLTAAHATS